MVNGLPDILRRPSRDCFSLPVFTVPDARPKAELARDLAQLRDYANAPVRLPAAPRQCGHAVDRIPCRRACRCRLMLRTGRNTFQAECIREGAGKRFGLWRPSTPES